MMRIKFIKPYESFNGKIVKVGVLSDVSDGLGYKLIEQGYARQLKTLTVDEFIKETKKVVTRKRKTK